MVRLAPLLGLGALAVHQLRYAIASDGTMTAGHGYLGTAGALLAGVSVVALAALLARVARGSGRPAPRIARLWAGTTLALVVVFTLQELAEGTSPIAHGGWLAAPLAAVVALVIALLARGATTARAPARRPWRMPPPARHAVRLGASAPRPGIATFRPVLARGPPPASA
jgi:hypothetical protein